jgi:oligoendopeptidase F
MAKSKLKRLPSRGQVKIADSWDLASLFPSDEAWETAFAQWERRIGEYAPFRGRLGDRPASLAKCLSFDVSMDRAGERLGTYAVLKASEDLAQSHYQGMLGRYRHGASSALQAASFIRPEIMAIPAARMQEFLRAKPLEPFRLQLERILRFKPYTLGDNEERLLAMQSEMAGSASQIFTQLHDADLRFGQVRNENGQTVELTSATYSGLMHSPKRHVRQAAFAKYYAQFQAHENTLAATLAASIQRDVYYAKARGYRSALAAALFEDNVPESVYDQLIRSVHEHLGTLHRYYDLRRRKMRLRDIHHYDTYVPILSQRRVRFTWRQSVAVILDALAPLGRDYVRVLGGGLLARWCDRYPNRGKQSGAFSCGSFDGDPYILMNYDPDVLDHVFTLAHEAGHSMHSYYSAKSQPYQYYNYSIFVAEVASTLNEQLLGRHLLARARSNEERAYLVNREIDAIRGTIFRQTMFAEFERAVHEQAERGEPLTVERFKCLYWDLLELYFGPDFTLDDSLRLECFRIPHFYRPFYVYKYATGLAASIALAHRILSGGKPQRDDYLRFLGSGCTKFPLDLLRDAGVDMASPEPVETALGHFSRLVDELERLL